MNITKMNTDVENISNQPNQVIGKAAELKKMFDKSGKDIKEYINTVLIPELEAVLQTKMNTDSKTSELVNDGDGDSPFATLKDVLTEIARLVDSSPDALNTLNELANALGNDPNFATTVLNLISTKTDKQEGKTLSSNDYTDAEKNKLSELPDNNRLNELLNSKVPVIYVDTMEEEFSYDDYTNDGLYVFVFKDGDSYSVHTLKVWWDFDTLYQEVDNRYRREFQYEWSERELFNVDFTPDEKKKVAEIDNKASLDDVFNSQTFRDMDADIQGLNGIVSTVDGDVAAIKENIYPDVESLKSQIEYHDFGIISEQLPKVEDCLSLGYGVFRICWNTDDCNYNYGILFHTQSDADDRFYLYSSLDGIVYVGYHGDEEWTRITASQYDIERISDNLNMKFGDINVRFEEELGDINVRFEEELGDINVRFEEEQDYMKDYVAGELATFDFIKVVDELPEEGLPNRMYFVPKADTGNQDLFDEYVWVDGKWEWITTKQVEIDLTGYVQKSAFTFDPETETLTIDM